ncbi:MAG: hypothetical protein ACREAX_04230 [Candidatus Nitrosotenuis sp.]
MKSFESSEMEKDLGRVRSISTLVKKRILESNPKYEKKIENLTQEELEDLDKVLALTEQILLKYQHKKEAYVILKEFSDLIRNWTGSLAEINDEVQELIILAKSSVSEIKTAQNDVSANFSFDDSKKEGRINLTKPAIPIYTQAYQRSPEPQYEQVV